MKLTEFFLSQLESEGAKTRRAIEGVPDGKDDWKPHDKSMAFGRLVALVAGMPGWVAMIVNDDSLDLSPPGGGADYTPPSMKTSADRVAVVDGGLAKARAALQAVNDDHLMKTWKLLVAGNTVSADPRHVVLRDTFGHMAHHRGQLTTYLRIAGAKVPAIYGPSADDNRFD
jgi:hypothetical protein